MIYFDSFGVEYIPKKIKKSIGNKNIKTNIFRIQSYDSIMFLVSKYLPVFDYSNKILTVVLTVFSSTNIFAHVKGKKKLLGLITSVFSLLFSLFFEIVIKLEQENKDPKVFKAKNERLILKSVCSVCNNKKSRFISKNEGSGLLSSLGIRTPLSKAPLLNVFF